MVINGIYPPVIKDGNWEIPVSWFSHLNLHSQEGIPIAMFDYQRVCGFV